MKPCFGIGPFRLYLSRRLIWFQWGNEGARIKISRAFPTWREGYDYGRVYRLPFGWWFAYMVPVDTESEQERLRWEEKIPDLRSWSISGDALIIDDEEEGEP